LHAVTRVDHDRDYNVRNYVKFEVLPPNQTNFAQLLKKAGYATSIAGKWQLGIDRGSIRSSGFDEYCLWSLDPEDKTPRYNNPTGFIQNGKELPAGKQYGPDVVSDFLIDFITRNKTRPFLCYYPMLLPHAPYEPTAQLGRMTQKPTLISYRAD
jgi:arylsulfatase A